MVLYLIDKPFFFSKSLHNKSLLSDLIDINEASGTIDIYLNIEQFDLKLYKYREHEECIVVWDISMTHLFKDMCNQILQEASKMQ